MAGGYVKKGFNSNSKGRPFKKGHSLWVGKKHSEETKEKMRQFRLGKKCSEETKLKISAKTSGKNNPMFGKRQSDSAKATIGKANLGNIYNLGRKRIDITGENHPKWKGGITPLTKWIRNLSEYLNWRKSVFERDGYSCVKCGNKTSGVFEAHHKTSFSNLMIIFLGEYSQFSPLEDRETLVRLATTYKPFWNVDNGETLCGNCHKKTPNYMIKKGV